MINALPGRWMSPVKVFSICCLKPSEAIVVVVNRDSVLA